MNRRTEKHAFLVILLFTALGCSSSTNQTQCEPRKADETVSSSHSLSIDQDALYWADRVLGAIVRQPRLGGGTAELAAAAPGVYSSLTATSTDVLWVDDSAGIVIKRVPLTGGAATTAAVGNGGPIGITADDQLLYLSRSDAAATGSELVEVDLGTGDERIVSAGTAALALAIHGCEILGTSCTVRGDGVWRVSRDSGERVIIVPNTYCPITLAVDGDAIYFSDDVTMNSPSEGPGIFRAPLAGGAAELVTPASTIYFAVWRGFVYTAKDGQIVRASADGEVNEIAPVGIGPDQSPSPVGGLAVADDGVYWIEGAATGVWVMKRAAQPNSP